MYPHRIRLRGPWEYETLARPEGAPPLSGRVIMPWTPGAAAPILAGSVRFRRRFGYPGRIDAHERVWLVVEGIATAIQAAVNGASLGEGRGNFEFDATHLLDGGLALRGQHFQPPTRNNHLVAQLMQRLSQPAPNPRPTTCNKNRIPCELHRDLQNLDTR